MRFAISRIIASSWLHDAMPKYYPNKVCGYWLYYTAFCVIEAMHVHASNDGKLRESGAAKFFVKSDGTTEVTDRGDLSERDIVRIQAFIKLHYQEMYRAWSEVSPNGFYIGK